MRNLGNPLDGSAERAQAPLMCETTNPTTSAFDHIGAVQAALAPTTDDVNMAYLRAIQAAEDEYRAAVDAAADRRARVMARAENAAAAAQRFVIEGNPDAAATTLEVWLS